MSRLPYEGRTKVHFLPNIADTDAPILAEFTAGTDLTTFVTKDGVQPGSTNNRVPTGGIDDAFNSEVQGSWSAAFSLKCFRDDTTDTAWTTLVRGLEGFVVIGYDSAAGIATGDEVQVWPAEFGTPNMDPSAADTPETFMADIAIQTPPVLDAVVTDTP
jgi:hypothetical protein